MPIRRLLAGLALDRVQQRAGGVEVQRVAELVRLGRAGGFDARGLLARVVASEAALAERPEEIAKGAVAEKVECLVGHLELHRRLIVACAAPLAAPLPSLALGLEIGRHRDVAFFAHALDDLLDQLLELRSRIVLVGVRGIPKQLLDGLFRQHAAVEQRVEDRVVQRLHRPLFLVHAAARVPEPAGEQQIR